MSDDLIQVRSAIPGYAGFADAPARRLTDQQVRAWVGERLAALGERLGPASAAALEDLIVHCQFGDQRVIKALEDNRFSEPGRSAKIEADDARLVAAAMPSDRVDAAGLAGFIAGVQDALRRRNDLIVGLKSG